MCRRKWWLNKVRKLETGSSKSQIFGTVVHSVIERFLLADDLGRDVKTGKPVDLYPEGWHIAKSRFGKEGDADGEITPIEQDACKRLIKAAIENGVIERLPGRVIEKNFNRSVIKTPCSKCGGKIVVDEKKCPQCDGDGKGCTVQIVGFIDLIVGKDQIQDHKTTKSMRYAKSANALQKNEQILIYAHELLQQAEDRGEPLPNVITVRHNVFSKEEDKVRKTETQITREQIEAQWNLVKRNAEIMVQLREGAEDYFDIAPPENLAKACNSYGGCPFMAICTGSENEETYEKRVAFQKQLLQLPNQPCVAPVVNAKPQESPNMAIDFTAKLAAKRAQNAVVASGAAVPAPSINPTLPVQQTAPVAAPQVQPQAVQNNATVTGLVLPNAPDESHNLNGVKPPPWAQANCGACHGSGFNSKGNPCRMCDAVATKNKQPGVNDFIVTMLGDGVAMWVSKTDPDVAGHSYVTGTQPAPIKAQEKIAETPPAVAAALAAQEAASLPKPEEIVPLTPVVPQTAPVPQVQPTTTLANATNLEVVGTVGDVKKRGRSKASVGTTPATAAPSDGLTLLINCNMAKGGSCVSLHDLFKKYGDMLAEMESTPTAALTYYDLDPFKRRDELAKAAPTIASELGNSVVVCSNVNGNPDLKCFLDALRMYATTEIVSEQH